MAAPALCIVCSGPMPDRHGMGGLALSCSDKCRAIRKHEQDRARYRVNPQKWKEAGQKRRREKPEAVRASKQKWRAANLDKARKSAREWASRHKAEQLAYLTKRLSENPDYRRVIHRKWREANRDKRREHQRLWTADHLESERARRRDYMRRKRAAKGKRDPIETRAKRSASLRRAWADGRHSVNVSYRYTSLAQALHVYLESTRAITLEPEVRFGRFTVDLYDRANHVAYEADGTYWHQKNEAARPGYHADRDAYLQREFSLSVIHYTDTEINTLTRGEVA